MKYLQIKFVLAIFILISPLYILAQTGTGTISGTVTDTLKHIIPFANIQVKGLKIKTTSDKSGNFKLTGLPAGTQTIRVSITGYKTREQQIPVTADQISTIDFTLGEASSDLKEVIVSASRRAESLRKHHLLLLYLRQKKLLPNL
jgi:iron complex outermembrane receptor protein